MKILKTSLLYLQKYTELINSCHISAHDGMFGGKVEKLENANKNYLWLWREFKNGSAFAHMFLLSYELYAKYPSSSNLHINPASNPNTNPFTKLAIPEEIEKKTRNNLMLRTPILNSFSTTIPNSKILNILGLISDLKNDAQYYHFLSLLMCADQPLTDETKWLIEKQISSVRYPNLLLFSHLCDISKLCHLDRWRELYDRQKLNYDKIWDESFCAFLTAMIPSQQLREICSESLKKLLAINMTKIEELSNLLQSDNQGVGNVSSAKVAEINDEDENDSSKSSRSSMGSSSQSLFNVNKAETQAANAVQTSNNNENNTARVSVDTDEIKILKEGIQLTDEALVNLEGQLEIILAQINKQKTHRANLQKLMEIKQMQTQTLAKQEIVKTAESNPQPGF